MLGNTTGLALGLNSARSRTGMRTATSMASLRSVASTIRVVHHDDEDVDARRDGRHTASKAHQARDGKDQTTPLSTMKKALMKFKTPSPRKQQELAFRERMAATASGINEGKRLDERREKALETPVRARGRRDLKGVLMGVANRLRISPEKVMERRGSG